MTVHTQPRNKSLLLAGMTLAFAGPALAQTPVAIPASFAHPAAQADTAAPGFRVRTAQAAAPNTLATTLFRTEAQLAGLLLNPETGEPWENVANLETFGADGYYAETTVVDYDQNGASMSGLFIPGIPGTTGSTDSIAMEVVTYLDLQPGTHTMVVRSDDGFRVTAAPNPRSHLQTLVLGYYDGGRGAEDSVFSFTVSAAGLYGFRLIYNEGGSDASVSWSFEPPSEPGARILINDPNTEGSVKAYQKLTAPEEIVTEVASPAPSSIDNPSKPTLTYRLVDSATAAVNTASVELHFDGVKVTPTVTKTAGKTTVTYPVPALLDSLSVHTVKLVYADSAPTPNVTTTEYAFTVLKYANLILPAAPVVSENFDTWEELAESPEGYPDSGVYTSHGWTIQHISAGAGAGWDLSNPNSDSFLSWVLISKERFSAINWDSGRRLNVVEQFVNGVKVDTLIDGNFLYAESDQRSGSQVQYLFTPDFDFTGKTNLHLYFHSIYEQNQDNIASVEYSTDEGATWLPILYMVDREDIIMDGGNINADATLREPRGDTATYFDPETGETLGGTYGAFIGVKEDLWATLAPYISGRINDDATESKRVEFYPIPQADNKAKVRFRFAQAGTASWYFGIDNFAVYAMPAEALPVLTVAQTAGKVVLSWPAAAAGYKLQSSTSTATGWTDLNGAVVSGVNMTLEVTPTAPRVFYRLLRP